MKTVSIIISLVFVFIFSFLSGTSHATPMSTSDLWDVSQGATVTSDSGILQHHYSFDVRDMFGGTFGTTEVGNTIFSYDSNTAGSLHFVEWQTASPITLQSFNLVAVHDGDANARGFIRGCGHASFDTSPPNAAQKQGPQAAMAAWGPCSLLVARGNQISYH